MLHYSCDRCGRTLSSESARYVVKIDMHPTMPNPPVLDGDFETDHLEQLDQLLTEAEPDDTPDAPPAPKQLRFDLCTNCHSRFAKDPLNREALKILFSNN